MRFGDLAFILGDPAAGDCLVCERCGRVATVHAVIDDEATGCCAPASDLRVVGVCSRCSGGFRRVRRALGMTGLTLYVIWSVATPVLARVSSHPHGVTRVLLYCHIG